MGVSSYSHPPSPFWHLASLMRRPLLSSLSLSPLFTPLALLALLVQPASRPFPLFGLCARACARNKRSFFPHVRTLISLAASSSLLSSLSLLLFSPFYAPLCSFSPPPSLFFL